MTPLPLSASLQDKTDKINKHTGHEMLAEFDVETPRLLRLGRFVRLTDDDFFELCQQNPLWQVERNANGDLEFMEPSGWESDAAAAESVGQLRDWAREDGQGIPTASSAGFRLPNTAIRSPDAAWVLRERLATLSREQRQRFLPLCPDFCMEVLSPSDSLQATQAKMGEYLENGLRLGLLLDPLHRRAWVYRPGVEPVFLDNPQTIDCNPELPGFVLDTQAVFNAGI